MTPISVGEKLGNNVKNKTKTKLWYSPSNKRPSPVLDSESWSWPRCPHYNLWCWHTLSVSQLPLHPWPLPMFLSYVFFPLLSPSPSYLTSCGRDKGLLLDLLCTTSWTKKSTNPILFLLNSLVIPLTVGLQLHLVSGIVWLPLGAMSEWMPAAQTVQKKANHGSGCSCQFWSTLEWLLIEH